jgi:hypothetical protein
MPLRRHQGRQFFNRSFSTQSPEPRGLFMSAWIKTVVSREIRANIAKAAEAIKRENERASEEKRLRERVERSLAARDEAAKKASPRELADLNQRALALLALIEPEKAPEPQFATKAPANIALMSVDQEASAKAIRKILGYYEELNKLEPQRAANKKPLLAELAKTIPPERLLTIADSLRSALSRAITLTARSEIHRAELEALRLAQPETPAALELLEEIQGLLEQKTIADEAMAAIREKIRVYQERIAQTQEADLAQQIAELAQKFLADEGYEVMDAGGLTVGGDCLIAGDRTDYPVQCHLDAKGALTFRQLKVAASREEAEKIPNEYQKALDKERTVAFCRVHERLTQALAKAGFKVEAKELQKAGEGLLPVLVDPRKAATAKKTANNLKSAVQGDH